MRPVLIHATARLWRDRATLQLGTRPGQAQVLSGVDEGARHVLGLLDGVHDLDAVVAGGAGAGCPPERVTGLLDLLSGAGLLRDADAPWPGALGPQDRERLTPEVLSLGLMHPEPLTVLQRRDATEVLVLGGGRVGAAVASLLAASGVGTVDVLDAAPAGLRDAQPAGLHPSDVGCSREQAARDRVREQAPTARGGPILRPRLVVLAPTGPVDDAAVRSLLAADLPHLYAGVRETVGVVGPLVLPGRTACLSCLDQERTDRDPGWPVLAAQLSMPTTRPTACASGLAAAVAAQTVLQALEHLDGGAPATVDGTLELALPGWEWQRRSWAQHPQCGCQWQATG